MAALDEDGRLEPALRSIMKLLIQEMIRELVFVQGVERAGKIAAHF